MITSCLFDDAGSVCYSLQNMRAFFAACQRRRLFAAGCGSEAFLLPSVAAGASFNWQCPASLVGFDPTLLICEKKRGVEPPRRSCPKEPLERGSSGLFPKQRDRGPSGTPGLPGTEIFPVGRCYVLLSAQSSGVRQTWQTRRGAKQISSGNFFARAVHLSTAAGTPSPPQSPRKDFCRAKMPCGGERLPNLLLGSLIVVRTANRVAIAIQNESTNKKP